MIDVDRASVETGQVAIGSQQALDMALGIDANHAAHRVVGQEIAVGVHAQVDHVIEQPALGNDALRAGLQVHREDGPCSVKGIFIRPVNTVVGSYCQTHGSGEVAAAGDQPLLPRAQINLHQVGHASGIGYIQEAIAER